MRIALAVALCCLLMQPPPVRGEDAPRLSEKGCGVAADMVLVARSLASEGVAREQAEKIMARVYESYDQAPVIALRKLLTDFAYRRVDKPMDLANALGRACLTTGGHLNSMIGTST